MAGFFVEVLEVESVDRRKTRDVPPREVIYARFKCAGGSFSCRVRDGVKILPGFSGKLSGPVRLSLLKREFNGRLSDVVAFVPVEVDTWVQGQQVNHVGSEMEGFLKK